MTPSQSIATRDSWRLRDPRETQAKSKRLRFAIWSLVFLVLISCLVVFLFWWWDHRVTYVGIMTTQHGRLQVPLIPYQQHDKQALDELFSSYAKESSCRRLAETELSGLPEAADAFVACEAGRRDAAILYVSTHGLTYNGEPYLLQSDFALPTTGASTGDVTARGLYPVSEFLTKLSESNAGLKLLLLDAGRIAYDPQLGVLSNSFPHLLAREVEAIDDPNLWVLVSHSNGQISGVDSSSEHTLFGKSVLDAFGGKADQLGDENLELSLSELYMYVWNSVARWTVEGKPLQAPMLLRGTKGFVGLDAALGCDIILAELPPTAEEDEKEAGDGDNEGQVVRTAPRWPPSLGVAVVSAYQDSDGNSTVENQEDLAEGDSVPGKSDPAEVHSSKTSTSEKKKDASADSSDATENPLGAASELPPEKEPAEASENTPLATLIKAWQQRDELMDSSPPGWSPVDFAPVYWRRLEASLLADEARIRCGLEPRSELDLVVADMISLETEMQGGMPQRYRTPLLVEPVALGLREFRRDRQLSNVDDPAMAPLANAWRRCNRIYYDIPYFIRWQAHVALNQNDLNCTSQQRTKLLNNLALVSNRVHDYSAPPEDVAELNSLLMLLEGPYNEIREALEARCNTVIASKLAAPQLDRACDALLATPLLDAQNRLRLLKLRASEPVEDPAGLERPADEEHIPDLSTLSSVVGWEIEFLRICDTTGPVPNAVTDLDTSSCDDLGTALQKYYGNLRGELGPNRSSLVWLVNPREESPTASVVARPVLPRAKLPEVSPSLVIKNSPRLFHLEWGKAIPISLRYEAQGVNDNGVVAVVDFDPSQLVVKNQEGSEVAAGTNLRQSFTEAGIHELVLYVESKNLVDAETEPAELFVQLQATDVKGDPLTTDKEKLLCHFPRPSDVDVWTKRHVEPRRDHGLIDGAEINPYPNRTTPYHFFLANQSGTAKDFRVQLVAIPNADDIRSPQPTFAPGRILVDGQAREEVQRRLFEAVDQLQVDPRARILAEARVSLPEDGNALVPVAFQPPGTLDAETAPAKEPPDPKTPPAAPPTEPAPSGTGEDISYGMAMVLTNALDPKDRIVKWISILPAHPSQFLSVENVRYDGKRVRADLRLPNAQQIPEIAETPVVVDWVKRDDDRFTDYAAKAVLNLETPQGALSAAVPAQSPNVQMVLTVNEFPRAFAFDIPCVADSVGKSLEDRQFDIRIVGIKPHFENDAAAAAPEKEPPEIPVVKGETSEIYIRSVPENPCKDLTVGVEIDAPNNAFEGRRPMSTAEVDGQPIRSDRKVQTTLIDLTPDGGLSVAASVKDHEIEINVEGRTPVPIRARLTKIGQDPKTQDVVVVLDGIAPRVDRINDLPNRIIRGQRLEFSVGYSDTQSGVILLNVAVDVNDSGEIDDGDVQKEFSVDPERGQHLVSISTEKLEPSSDGYHVLAQVTDRVGLKSDLAASATRVIVEEMKKVEPKKPTTGSILGYLHKRGHAADPANGRVEIVELSKSVEPENGKFRFDNVPLGPTYTLKATGSLIGAPQQGETQATAKPTAEAKYSDVALELKDVPSSKKEN